MAKLKRSFIKLCALLGATSLFTGFGLESFESSAAAIVSMPEIVRGNTALDTGIENYFDGDVVQKLPSSVSANEKLSIIVSGNTPTVMDAYETSGSVLEFTDYATSWEGIKAAEKVEKENNALIKKLKAAGIRYELGNTYNTVLSGFEIVVKASDFERVEGLFNGAAKVIVGDEYERAETEVVTNEVEVYETGIFDSGNCAYQGDGVVVAVLDTGLDYTHSAFSVENFERETEAFTLENVSSRISQTTASQLTSGLTGEDVYLNAKVPFAYDYADKDPDVLPINSEHGTHVAGIIAGKNDVITGVAPSAQLAIMKVFSDTATGAKTSWILAAVEDCVNLGVDVINMSLGSSCGFTREVDNENINRVYDKVREAGISLIAAASNDYNATQASKKNGSLGLTSNPDSGTIGAPAAYEAALSVASVDGVMTPYIMYGEEIVYFKEASTSEAKTKDFVNDLLGDQQSKEYTYVTIPGIGRSSDYAEKDYSGKIVLVKRGETTFEEKIRIALKEKHADGVIIYNNVSGDISMSVGDDIGGAVCSLSQDDGEMLAKAGTGKIFVSKDQVAGPFMSDFSSWGPTSDLKIKPEITAHGGEIYSAVPGEAYDRLSGTSMAAPNQAGATALIRQYVKDNASLFAASGALTTVEVTDLVNKLMMSTADIVYNKNGLPYAVRKQGAGLVNIKNTIASAGYITTLDQDGKEMNRSKFELGDDKEKKGVYEMTFKVHNISSAKVSYEIGSIVQTEGVSKTYTSHDEKTVTQDGYLLDGAQTNVLKVEGGVQNGNGVTVNAGSTATVTVQIVLSDEDKAYLDASFENGMYVEGFVTLTAKEGTTVNMNAPLLAFYGDWNQAPVFDEEYYDTHKDEINKGLDERDKVMEDAYATRVIGSLYSDYISTLGSYYFVQDPAATQIAATKDKIAVSNQEMGESSSVTGIYGVWAGLLRNAKEANIQIVEDSTGRVIFEKTEYNVRKSHGVGTTYSSSIDFDFKTLEHNLKNNTKYTVTITTYIDYGTKAEQDASNVRNVFEFPLYVDFESPIVTDVTYRSEYDKTTQKTKLFADLSVYDNHYAMGLQLGQIVPWVKDEDSDSDEEYLFSIESFGKYITPVYSTYNSTSTVTVELTDYIAQIKNSIGMGFDENGETVAKEGINSFIAVCYDYAMNAATYEIRLPDEVLEIAFKQDSLKLNPNETQDLSLLLDIYPTTTWAQTLDYEIVEQLDGNGDEATGIVDIVNQTLLPKKKGTAVIKVYGYDKDGNVASDTLTVTVLGKGDEGYLEGNAGYTVPDVNKFTLTGYKTNKAYYSVSSEEREIGVTDGIYAFDKEDYSLSMYPSESVTLNYVLDSYFPERTGVVFRTGNSRIATVDETGTIVAQAEGSTIVTISVTVDGKATSSSERVVISVKDPFITNSIYLMSYKGLGDTVEIPSDRGITTIYAYAFSNYEYVEKDLEAGDIIDEEDPYYIKQHYIGEDTIKKVIIPEGVTTINEYAFANLTALEEVVLPKSLKTIGVGAFYNCTKLTTINLEYAKFINEKAFANTAIESVTLTGVVAIGNYTFSNTPLQSVKLPATSQSLGVGAFYDCKSLGGVTFEAEKMKLGELVFAGCTSLRSIDVNAAVIPTKAFYGCSKLETVNLGKDVSVIGEYAFGGTSVKKFTVSGGALSTGENGALVYKGSELIIAAPMYAGNNNKLTLAASVTSIAAGAFAGNTKLSVVTAKGVKSVGAYAFAQCSNLKTIEIDAVETVGAYAFSETKLTATPSLAKATSIGRYAFASTDVSEVVVADGAKVGDYAFAYCNKLENVTLGKNVTVGDYAFYSEIEFYFLDPEDTSEELNEKMNTYYEGYYYYVMDGDKVVNTYVYYSYDFTYGIKSLLTKVTVGEGTTLGDYAFAGNANLNSLTLNAGVSVGDYAFYDATALKSVDLSKVASVGSYAFTGTRSYDLSVEGNTIGNAYEIAYIDGQEVIVDYKFSDMAPSFKEANLASATSIGDYAFAYNTSLEKVTLGENLEEIANYAFAYSSISEIVLSEKVKTIGEGAFYFSKIAVIDLSKVEAIGNSAFARTELSEVTLKEGVKLGDGAFNYCESLASVGNLDKVAEIGAYAFQATALQEVILTAATKIGDFAFGNSALTKVTFGEQLKELGENPFYACEIETYGRYEDVTFAGATIGKELNETYDISDTVRVIGGVLYQVVPNGGLELVSYPIAKTQSAYVLEEGTKRISARAFEGAKLQNVTLAASLQAIGDKAFYGCEDLKVVIFKSYAAPILEEEYDTSHITMLNLPMTGMMPGGDGTLFEGLGISKYFMWNLTSSFNNFYFGANFVDYVGRVEDKLVMVKPANGKNYDSFIFTQYFDTIVQGDNALMEATIAVIEKIAALPVSTSITLAQESLVAEVRAAYESIASLEQKALVSNYSKLTDAEAMIAYLKAREEANKPSAPIVEEEKNGFAEFLQSNWIGLTIAGVVLLGFAAYVIVDKVVLKKGKNDKEE
ncbi:MAG: leucine-rich repeat protein [Clostridia bacterium]|nr:leucine-rich repeat protein [Clostridia bacterium]